MKLFLHFLFWSLTFLQGSIQYLQLPSFLYKVGMPLIVVVLFFLSSKQGIRIFPHLRYIVILFFIVLFSFLINSIPIFNFIYFLTYLFLPYFYFLIILNEPNNSLVKNIKKIIIAFVLLQIPMVIIGFILNGQHEANSGTLTNSDGSVATIFPSIISAYVFSLYIINKKIKYILIIIGFFLFGLIGEKRAITLFIPLVLLLVYIVPIIKGKTRVSIKTVFSFIMVMMLSGAAFYAAVRLNPSLNKEGKIGGSFDYQYFMDYAKHYNEIGRSEKSEMQRLEGLLYFNDYMLNQPLGTLLFGEGAGKLISSRYSTNPDENLMLVYYNVRYGGRMGFIWLLLQIGYLGVLVFFSMILRFARIIWKNFKYKSEYIAFVIITFIFLLDLLFYSYVSVKYFYTMGLYMFLYALIYRDALAEKNNLLKRRNVN